MSFARGSEKGSKRWEYYLITTALTFLGLLLGSVLSAKISGGSQMIADNEGGWLSFAVQLVPFTTALIVFFACVHFIHKSPILSVITNRKRFDFKRFFFAFSLWLAVLTGFLIVAVLLGSEVNVQWNPSKFFPLLAVSLLLLPLQTAFEDIIYRGYFFQGLTHSLGKAWLSVVIVAGVFGYMHIGNPEVKLLGIGVVWYYVISGLFLGILAHLDDGLELGMGYHFANNFFGAVVLTNTWQVFQTDAVFIDSSEPYFGWENWLTLLIAQPLLLFLFYKIYKWKSSSAKITE